MHETYGLAAEDAVSYLVGLGVLSPRTVVRGTVAVHDVSSRNRNFLVIADPGPSLVVKIGAQRFGSSVRHEAAMYEHIATDDRLSSLRSCMPTFVRYDAGRDVLVLEVAGDRDRDPMTEFRRRRATVATAASYGRVLARLHAAPAFGDEYPSAIGSQTPGILEIHRPEIDGLAFMTTATVDLIKLIQATPGLPQQFDRLSRDWRASCVAHNDVRWSNWVVARSGARTSVKLLDWELAGMGDPMWDLGSLFAQYLGAWLASLPISATGEFDWHARTAMKLEHVHAAMQSTWRAYGTSRDGVGTDPDEMTRAVRYGGARLIQNAFETAQASSYLPAVAIASVQLASNVLLRPHEAAVRLLGLPLVEVSRR